MKHDFLWAFLKWGLNWPVASEVTVGGTVPAVVCRRAPEEIGLQIRNVWTKPGYSWEWWEDISVLHSSLISTPNLHLFLLCYKWTPLKWNFWPVAIRSAARCVACCSSTVLVFLPRQYLSPWETQRVWQGFEPFLVWFFSFPNTWSKTSVLLLMEL